MDKERKNKQVIVLFFIAIAFFGLSTGLADNILSNFFKDAYNVTTVERGIIEFPREIPGIVSLFVISGLAFIGDFRIGIIAQMLSIGAILVLGNFTPSFVGMCAFLFIYSLGVHIYMPLGDSMCLSIFKDSDNIGEKMGQYKSCYNAFFMVAAILVFFGFRYNFFSFKTTPRLPFLLSAVCSVVIMIALLMIVKIKKPVTDKKKKFKLIFHKKYKYYYALSVLNGVQKQIMLVFGPWVLIELLSQQADTLALLTIASSFLSIFFLRLLGRWIDRFGIRKIMYVDAFSFIGVYTLYGILTMLIVNDAFPNVTIAVVLTGVLFSLDRVSMNVGVVRSVYINNIIIDRNDLSQILSTGIGIDHVITIMIAPLTGLVWTYAGPQYIFFIAAAISFINVYIAGRVKIEGERA